MVGVRLGLRGEMHGCGDALGGRGGGEVCFCRIGRGRLDGVCRVAEMSMLGCCHVVARGVCFVMIRIGGRDVRGQSHPGEGAKLRYPSAPKEPG